MERLRGTWVLCKHNVVADFFATCECNFSYWKPNVRANSSKIQQVLIG